MAIETGATPATTTSTDHTDPGSAGRSRGAEDGLLVEATRRSIQTPVAPSRGALRPLGTDEVRLTGGFWAERQRINAVGIIPHANAWEERVGWIDNFRAAVDGDVLTTRTGREFADSDVYKLLEAMAWEHGRTGDAGLDARIREVAALVGRVQEEDGYLHTLYGREGQAPRYSDLEWGHELYCYGHLIQAAVARLRTGVHDELVDIALRAADHVCLEFGQDGRDAVCGHPEIEPALVELYRATGERRYLDQARLFVQRSGHRTLADIEFSRSYFQDDVPVRDADVMVGHAVRALYLASGAIDVAVEDADRDFLTHLTAQFTRTLARRTYITGGMGSHHQDEAFGDDFELPPDRAYAETCAGIGSVMVAWRLALATGDLSWGDVVERALFNVVAASPSPEGTAFFYTNPLHKRVPGAEADPDVVSPRAFAQLRAPWFEVSCCPTNVARTFAQLGSYIATATDYGVQLHQLASATISTVLETGAVTLDVATRYPDSGEVTITVVRAPAGETEIAVRVPRWARGAATLDGERVDGDVARVRRTFADGDIIAFEVPLVPRVSRPDPRIDAVRGCVAIERGPLVLCAESVDLDGDDVAGLSVDPTTVHEDAGTVRLTGTVASPEPERTGERVWPYGSTASTGGSHRARTVQLALTPYHSWAQRGPSTMRVWLPADVATPPHREEVAPHHA